LVPPLRAFYRDVEELFTERGIAAFDELASAI
jgi:hypothetical protein